MSISSIGRIVSRQNVEQQVLLILQTWLESTYLPEVEAQNGLPDTLVRPPSADSYYGGVDDQTWSENMLPAIIVVAEPTEDAIHLASAYQQWFEVQITAVVVGDDENSGRTLADWYGAAIMSAVAQSENLDGFAGNTLLIGFPRVTFVEEPPDRREFAQVTAIFHMLISDVVNETGRPAEPGWPPPAINDAETTDVTVTGVPIDEPV